MSVLVTGGAGFIGSHTVEALLSNGECVVALDNFSTYYSPQRKWMNVQPFLLHPCFHLVEGDICDRALLQTTLDEAAAYDGGPIDRIIHLAAMAGVRASIEDPLSYARVNVEGTQNVAEIAVQRGVKHLIFASSSSVYGSSPVPYREDARTDSPLSPYAATKKMAEVMLYTYHHLCNLPVTVLRFFSVYGPGGRPDMAVYLFTDWIAKGAPVRLYGDGSQGRDYTYVSDIVAGILAALSQPRGYEIYNLGNSRPQSNRSLIKAIERELGKSAIVEHYQYPSLDPEQTCADISRAQRTLGYNPQVPLEEGIGRFIQWYRGQSAQVPQSSLPGTC
jgi:UDP-glucuronate 4-epimerase